MARPLNDSPYLYGLHDPGGEHVMAEQGIPGWILFTEAIGSDPSNHSGMDYSRWADQGFGVIVRLNNGYEPHGTIPHSARYAAFAERCANFVRSSRGAHIWIIGNEMNFAVERPGVSYDRSTQPLRLRSEGEVIRPGMYAECYRRCRSAIRKTPGHEKDQVVVGAVAPWNTQTPYQGNPQGDWVQYFQDILKLLGPDACDGIAIHAYTHGPDPQLVYTDTYMNPPFQNRQYNFRAYRDFLSAVPQDMRDLPVYLTETNQGDSWTNQNLGWVQRVYGEIDAWNRLPATQVIRAVILYRWPHADQWGIDGKAGVIEDFKASMRYRYNWEAATQAKPAPPVEPPVEKPATPVAPSKPATPVAPSKPATPVAPSKPAPEPAEPATPQADAPITFHETGKTARGLFAAFHRRYGMEITGCPISDEYIHPESGLKTQDWQRLSMEEAQGAIRLRLTGQEAANLRVQMEAARQENARLKRVIEQLRSGTGGPLEPPATDITAQLPRDPARLVSRPASDLRYVVIHHTGTSPGVGPERVAQAHRAKWPAIIGQYFISGDGRILQTNRIEQAVSADVGWIYYGINIIVAGNFDQSSPTDLQMAALADLCAWLLSRYGLAETALRGASEFMVTSSPGQQWLTGRRWKDELIERVRAVTAASPQPASGKAIAELRDRIGQLETQVADLEALLARSEEARAEIQARLDAVLGGDPQGQKIAKPPITDITHQLPRTPGSLRPRPEGGVRFVVINHTAMDPSVPVDQIAASHQRHWGAILYHYLVTAEGDVLQTNALDEVVGLEQPWVEQGVNVALAGDFSAGVPVDAQIQAAAQLSAWLIQEFDLPSEAVKGVCEFIGTQSPGAQWLSGAKWKQTLLQAIDRLQRNAATGEAAVPPSEVPTARGQAVFRPERSPSAAHPVPLLPRLRDSTPDAEELLRRVEALMLEKAALESQLRDLEADRTRLTAQIEVLSEEKAALTEEVASLKASAASLYERAEALNAAVEDLKQRLGAASEEKALLQARIAELEARILALQAEGSPGLQQAKPSRIQAPPISDIVDSLPKHASLRYETRPVKSITHIAIHHSAGSATVPPERIAQYHVRKGWPGIGYHFYVQPDGTIFQTNRLETISYQVYGQNHYSIGICIAGAFINGAIPTTAQFDSVGHLVAWLMQELDIPLKNVLGHKEFPQNATSCPGADWLAGKRWKETLLARVRALQDGQASKSIGHYVLFWQHAGAWASEDWEAAAGYIARFRPTAGFTPEEARNAAYVTIVGGVSGVPVEVEQMLAASGCKVERIAGIDAAETGKLLDELARSGRRFQTFDVQ